MADDGIKKVLTGLLPVMCAYNFQAESDGLCHGNGEAAECTLMSHKKNYDEIRGERGCKIFKSPEVLDVVREGRLEAKEKRKEWDILPE